jgi:benzylsuccinate CoA-transferase BbsF subunit
MNTTSTARPGVLSCVRVLDFTWKTVGPWSTRLLTHYGAEVIHVERAGGWDDHRYNAAPSIVTDEPKVAQTLGMKKVYSDPQFNTHRDESAAATERPKLYAAPYFNTLHNGKLAISLNTKSPEGLKIYRSYGPTAAAQSGLSLASGLPGKPPAGWGFSYLDVMGGWMGGLSLIQGLLQAKKTGEGCHIDYSVTEGAMSMLGTYMLDYQVNGRRTRRPDFPPGNRAVFPALAPHNTYRCAGRDRNGQDWWIFIACETQVQFETLCSVMEQPGLVLDTKFATNEARVTNQAELDQIISNWTRPRRRYDIMRKCQAAGIVAAVVQNAEDRVEYDPQLQHREVFPVIENPEVGGAFSYERYPVRLSRTPATVHSRAPVLAEHNQYVFGELLQMSEAEINSLRERGVI